MYHTSNVRLSAVGAQPFVLMEVMDAPVLIAGGGLEKTVKSVHCTLKETEKKTGPAEWPKDPALSDVGRELRCCGLGKSSRGGGWSVWGGGGGGRGGRLHLGAEPWAAALSLRAVLVMNSLAAWHETYGWLTGKQDPCSQQTRLKLVSKHMNVETKSST